MVKKALVLLIPMLLLADKPKHQPPPEPQPDKVQQEYFNLGFTCGRIWEFRNENADQADRIMPDLLASCSVFEDNFKTEVQ